MFYFPVLLITVKIHIIYQMEHITNHLNLRILLQSERVRENEREYEYDYEYECEWKGYSVPE